MPKPARRPKKQLTLAERKREFRADNEELKNLSGRARDYRFLLTEKDPIIDLLRTEVQTEFGSLKHEVLAKISYESGVSEGTLREWFFGSTRYPRRLTTRFVMEAIGITIQYIRRDGTQILRNGHS